MLRLHQTVLPDPSWGHTRVTPQRIRKVRLIIEPDLQRHIFRRYPERHYEITEGECAQEDLVPGKDKYGNDIFVPSAQNADGSVRAVK